MCDQAVCRQAHQGEAEVKADHVLGDDQAKIACHGQQEEHPESAACGYRIPTPSDIDSGKQPQQAAEAEKHPAGLIDAQFAAQQ